ncbi:pyridoxamine 5'-phosphate oxidase family protein [Sphingomonas sp. PB4P5]|uniref:pyridoxamine 5'-phosphate oxidase family protein n=1 Tax=Parasphingomonas puruogangriensis TaxID=3096155 RepID=UPI002FC805F2
MRKRFFDLAFTDGVQAEQERHGSRGAYAAMVAAGGRAESDEALGPDEVDFITSRDSFYLGTVSETGWPHVQHRGGPPGFVRVLGAKTIGWADFSGNRQYVSIGNGVGNDRVALFLMDYPRRRRLKLLGRMTTTEIGDRPDLRAELEIAGYGARIEHAIMVEVEAFDWNCPQHIEPRYSSAQLEARIAPLRDEIEDLRSRLARAVAAR